MKCRDLIKRIYRWQACSCYKWYTQKKCCLTSLAQRNKFKKHFNDYMLRFVRFRKFLILCQDKHNLSTFRIKWCNKIPFSVLHMSHLTVKRCTHRKVWIPCWSFNPRQFEAIFSVNGLHLVLIYAILSSRCKNHTIPKANRKNKNFLVGRPFLLYLSKTTILKIYKESAG